MGVTKKKKTGRKNQDQLQVEYKRLFQFSPTHTSENKGHSLAQPHVRKVVQSVVTYGAYQAPI